MNIRKNIQLAKYTTFHIGGKAEYFSEIRNIGELKEAVSFAKAKKLKIFALGGGSNVLLPDKGIKGLVLLVSFKGTSFKNKAGHTLLSVGAGERWDDIVVKAVKRGLGGIENLSLIPGTLGGAIYQNIGAYGVEIKDYIDSVEFFDGDNGIVRTLKTIDCRFGYRNSIFQDVDYENCIIIGATLKLSSNYSPKINYPDLTKYFENKKPSIQETRKAVIKIRKTKLQYPTPSIGTAGSFFKNPIITSADFKKLISDYPDIKGHDIGDDLVKLSAGQLIEKTGWKAKKSENVGVSKKHALVLISYQGAKSKEILMLAKKIQASVLAKFRIKLEPEVKIIQ